MGTICRRCGNPRWFRGVRVWCPAMEGPGLIDELSGVCERLKSLPDDAFAERWDLRRRQQELKDQIATMQASLAFAGASSPLPDSLD